MGESVSLTAEISGATTGKRAGYRVVPFVNGKRWGAIETTGSDGKTTHLLPLPNPGTATIQALLNPPVGTGPRAEWIWGDTAADVPAYYFQRAFDFNGDPAQVILSTVVDDTATIYLNGHELGMVSGWENTANFTDLSAILVNGPNVLSVEAHSTGGLAGLLVRLAKSDSDESPLIVSDAGWKVFARAPYGWPFRAEEDGEAVRVLSGVAWSPWRRQMIDWPVLEDRSLDMTGTPLPPGTETSVAIDVKVARRPLQRPAANPAQRVGIQFEPWFTPHNASWASSHAVPLTGLYWSWNTDVLRQQMIWLVESGIDFLVVDWTNHLWDKQHWDERGDRANEIIHATTQLLEVLAQLREEGITPPTVVLYGGLNNGPSTTVAAMNEAMAWIYHTYVRNPRFYGLFEFYLDKPLFLIHNGGGPGWVDATGASHVDDSLFTVRYQSFQHEFNGHEAFGFWSWMDGTLEPVVTYFENSAEALTVSAGFFARGGWKKEGAYGRRGGWTLVEGFKQAFAHRPRFLQVHQYQEFAGQWEGFGYSANRDVYVDSYSVSLSDDIEPVSLTAHAYRGDGGWGFYYLNLLRALVDCYQQPETQTTVIAMDHPGYGKTVTGDTLPLQWTWTGKAPTGFRLVLNGRAQEFPADATAASIDLTLLPAGPFDINLTATGTQSRYSLSYTEASLPATEFREASTGTVLIYAP